MAWPGVVITVWHYWPRSKGARVIVTGRDRHIVSSESGEGMKADAPNLVSFLAWATDYYDGPPVREVSEEKGRQLEAEMLAAQKPKRRKRAAQPGADGGADGGGAA
jgi:hypothetical protein